MSGVCFSSWPGFLEGLLCLEERKPHVTTCDHCCRTISPYTYPAVSCRFLYGGYQALLLTQSHLTVCYWGSSWPSKYYIHLHPDSSDPCARRSLAHTKEWIWNEFPLPSFLREKIFSSEEEDLFLLFLVEKWGYSDVLQVGHEIVSNRREEAEKVLPSQCTLRVN